MTFFWFLKQINIFWDWNLYSLKINQIILLVVFTKVWCSIILELYKCLQNELVVYCTVYYLLIFLLLFYVSGISGMRQKGILNNRQHILDSSGCNCGCSVVVYVVIRWLFINAVAQWLLTWWLGGCT